MRIIKDKDGAIEIIEGDVTITVSPYMVEAFIETINSLYVIEECEVDIDVIDYKQPELTLV